MRHINDPIKDHNIVAMFRQQESAFGGGCFYVGFRLKD